MANMRYHRDSLDFALHTMLVKGRRRKVNTVNAQVPLIPGLQDVEIQCRKHESSIWVA